MTYPTYTQQQLRSKSLDQLKRVYSEIGCTVEVQDRRYKNEWMSAIAAYQSTKLQKIDRLVADEQVIAQSEFEQYIADQAQAIAPEELRAVEVSFFHHEYYAGDRLIAAIDYDNDLTQPWVITINNAEEFRAATPMICDRYIRIHYKDGSLPVQEQTATDTPYTTGNQIMVQIACECDKYDLELLDDGIYTSDGEKLGAVGCTDGLWFFKRVNQKRTFCDSVVDAVWLLQIPEEAGVRGAECKGEILSPPLPAPCSFFSYLPMVNEYLQYHPLEQLSSGELQRLFETAELVAV